MAKKAAKTAKQPIRSVGFISLGCPKNLVDSEKMLGLLAEDGLTITNDPSQADAIVINTCGFLQASKDESLEAIRDAAKFKKTGRCQRIIVAGCLAQRYQTKLLNEAPEIDSLVGVFDRSSVVAAVRGSTETPEHQQPHYLGKYHQLKQLEKIVTLEADQGRLRLTPRHYAYLRVSEGCNQGCSFCTIPSIRGPMRSKPIDRILVEARELAADGCKELNLIGQDTTSYGEDIGYKEGLSGLLRTLDKELDIPWVRLMYAYPSCFTDEMIRAIADSPRVLKYIDMPLQHINDEMLRVMRRRVTRKQTETLLHKLRKWVPAITIRTTFIAGSPGETDEQFEELLQFVKEFQFDMMGVFAFSPEPGTAMGKLLGQLPDKVKQDRVKELMLAQQEIAFRRAREMEGKTIRVLVDRPADSDADQWIARSSAQAPEIDSVTLIEARKLTPGELVDVNIIGSSNYDLLSRPANAKSRRLNVLR